MSAAKIEREELREALREELSPEKESGIKKFWASIKNFFSKIFGFFDVGGKKKPSPQVVVQIPASDKKGEKWKAPITKTIILVIFLSIIWFIQKAINLPPIVITLAFIGMIYFLVKIWASKNVQEYIQKIFQILLFIFLAIFGLPLIILLFASIKNVIPEVLTAFPIGILTLGTIIVLGLIIFTMQFKKGLNWLKWPIRILFILSVIMLFIAPAVFSGVFSTLFGIGDEISVAVALNDIKQISRDIGEGFADLFGGVKKGVERQIALASGDYFTGQVDANAQRKLGVFLTKMASVAKIYTEDEPIDIYATLKAESIGDEEIEIKLNCYLDDEDTPGRITPSTVKFMQYEEEAVDCIIQEGSDEPGFHTAKIQANFNFATSAYIKTYLMEKERLRSYKRQQIDPLDAFKITDKRPTAVYTQGPVMIGIGITKPPIGIEKGTGPTISITLENMWKGKIVNLTRFIVIVPAGIDVLDINGRTDILTCFENEEKENVCNMSQKDLEKIYKVDATNIENIRTFRLHTEIEDVEKLLEDMPIAIKNIKVTAEYDYQIKKELQISVRKKKE